MIDILAWRGLLRDNLCMGQLQLFSRGQLATMRDRTRARNYSAEGEEFRRDHERHREWGLTQRYGEKRRRLRFAASAQQASDRSSTIVEACAAPAAPEVEVRADLKPPVAAPARPLVSAIGLAGPKIDLPRVTSTIVRPSRGSESAAVPKGLARVIGVLRERLIRTMFSPECAVVMAIVKSRVSAAVARIARHGGRRIASTERAMKPSSTGHCDPQGDVAGGEYVAARDVQAGRSPPMR
jgi:hypothetical protein